MHKLGGVAFPKLQRQAQPERAAARPAGSFWAEVRRRAAVYRLQRKEAKERKQVLEMEVLQNAENNEEILAKSNALQNLRNCSLKSWRHACPALSACCNAVDGAEAATSVGQQPAETLRTTSSAWEERHWVVPEGEKLGPQRLNVTQCFRQGYCTCGNRNLPLRKCWQAVQKFMRTQFPNKAATGHLVDGKIVFAWRGVTEEQEVTLRFTFIALMYLKPFRPTFLELDHISQSASGLEADDESVVLAGLENLTAEEGRLTFAVHHVAGQPVFWTPQGFLDSLDLRQQWSIQVLHLSERGSVCMAPPGFVVACISGGPCIVWPGGEVPFELEAHEVFLAQQAPRGRGAAAPPDVEEGARDDEGGGPPPDAEAEGAPDEALGPDEEAEIELLNEPYQDLVELLASIEDEALPGPAVLQNSSSSSDSSSSSTSDDSSSSSSSSSDNNDDEAERNPAPPPEAPPPEEQVPEGLPPPT